MKTRIKLFLAVLCAGITAALNRNQLALANANPPADKPPVDPDLAKENTELKEKIAKLEAGQPKNNAEIKAKMAAGLSRDQAEAAVRNQASFDKKLKEKATAAK